MTSLYDIHIEDLALFSGDDGTMCGKGILWNGTKRLGFWEQDKFDGIDRFDFDFKKIVPALKAYFNEHKNDKVPGTDKPVESLYVKCGAFRPYLYADTFMNELMEKTMMEREMEKEDVEEERG